MQGFSYDTKITLSSKLFPNFWKLFVIHNCVKYKEKVN